MNVCVMGHESFYWRHLYCCSVSLLWQCPLKAVVEGMKRSREEEDRNVVKLYRFERGKERGFEGGERRNFTIGRSPLPCTESRYIIIQDFSITYRLCSQSTLHLPSVSFLFYVCLALNVQKT
jgi:hypothetical protein